MTASALRIRLGTRGSKLALWQTRHVAELLRDRYSGIQIEEVLIKTLGDRVTNLPLFKVGGQGLFVAEWFGAMGRTWGETPLQDQYSGGGVAWSMAMR